MAELETLRKNLDGIDDDIARLLHKRAEIVLEVKKAKEQGNIDIYSPARERQILDRVSTLVPNGQFPQVSLEKIFQNIIGATRSLIGRLNVSYVGPESSLDHEAAVKQFGEDLKFHPEASLDDVFAKVESGDSHYGIVCVRTSSGTVVQRVFDRLMQSRLVIVAELELRERLGLLGEGPGFSELQQVFSDARGFEKSIQWLKRTLPSAHFELVENTEIALKMAKGDRFAAAVGLESLADKNSLKLLASGINSDTTEDARYFVVGNRVPPASGKDKTSIVCAVKERAGVLRDILGPFSEKSITLLKIESRPMRGENYQFAFFLEAVGHQNDVGMSAVIEQLKSICQFVRVLGSYPSVCQ